MIKVVAWSAYRSSYCTEISPQRIHSRDPRDPRHPRDSRHPGHPGHARHSSCRRLHTNTNAKQNNISLLELHILGTPLHSAAQTKLSRSALIWRKLVTEKIRSKDLVQQWRHTSSMALPVNNGVQYKVKLGKSFSDRNNNAFHTISCTWDVV